MKFISNTPEQVREILRVVGVKDFSELAGNIPSDGTFHPKPGGVLKDGISEMEVVAKVKSLAAKNISAEDRPCFLGAGSYRHFVPAAVNALISRGEFLTAYTPYQPEASQGTLQATFEFQSLIAELYGMDAANASLYDGASALAESALLALRETNRKKVLVSAAVHPEYRQTLRTSLSNFEVVEIPCKNGVADPAELAKLCDSSASCVIVQNPNFFGSIEDCAKISDTAHGSGALSIVCANPVASILLSPPGECGADIAVGEGQPLGIPVNFGGPYLGLFACREKFLRKMPGRIVGMTKDVEGRRGFVLTLQTREQHIRREKATSNICTNESLMALAATIYLSLLGPEGLKEVAELCLQKSHYAAQEIAKAPGYSLAFTAPFFNEFVVRSKISPEKIRSSLESRGIISGLPLKTFYPELADCTLFCCTETNGKAQIDALVKALREVPQQ